LPIFVTSIMSLSMSAVRHHDVGHPLVKAYAHNIRYVKLCYVTYLVF